MIMVEAAFSLSKADGYRLIKVWVDKGMNINFPNDLGQKG